MLEVATERVYWAIARSTEDLPTSSTLSKGASSSAEHRWDVLRVEVSRLNSKTSAFFPFAYNDHCVTSADRGDFASTC